MTWHFLYCLLKSPPVMSMSTLWFASLHLGSLLAIAAGKNLPLGGLCFTAD